MYTYVDSNINPNLLCCICRTPFIEPVTTKTCSHTFCQGCILQALSISPYCPIDRSPLEPEHLAQADPIVRHLVEELIVECPHCEDGCRYTGQRQLVGAHVNSGCGYVRIPCNGRECEKMVRRKDISDGCAHKSEKDELRATSSNATCEFCSDDIPRSILKEHIESCLEALVSCKQVENGCSWSGRRISLDSHVTSCPYESIKGFFALNSTRLSTLSEENQVLRHKVDSLEGTIRLMQREFQSVKLALGPWYRPEGLRQPYRPPAPVERSVSDLDTFDTTGFNLGGSSSLITSNAPYHLHPSLSVLSPPLPPGTHSSSSSSLADYFPPEEPPRRASPRQNRLSPSSTLHSFDYNTTNNLQSVTNRSPVAPLDLSTTLEGSFTSLRESLVTLSAAQESQSRRQELALATEGLRINEEVGSLKAVVHGLRMQVHTIMMDRNAQVTGRFLFSNGEAGASSGGQEDESWSEAAPSSNLSLPGGGGWFPPHLPPPFPARYNQCHPTASPTSITKL